MTIAEKRANNKNLVRQSYTFSLGISLFLIIGGRMVSQVGLGPFLMILGQSGQQFYARAKDEMLLGTCGARDYLGYMVVLGDFQGHTLLCLEPRVLYPMMLKEPSCQGWNYCCPQTRQVL